MEGSWSVITVDPWRGESLLIKPLASFYTQEERERHRGKETGETPPLTLATISSQSPEHPRGAQTQTPLLACGLLTSQLPFSRHCSFTSQLLPNMATGLLIAGTLHSRTTKAHRAAGLVSASLRSSSVWSARCVFTM